MLAFFIWYEIFITKNVSGVYQKHIMITCNYVARNMGVSKHMKLSEARKQFPELVLINGEDLTPYRNMSYQITGQSPQPFCLCRSRLQWLHEIRLAYTLCYCRVPKEMEPFSGEAGI